jgi:hypothetical protein
VEQTRCDEAEQDAITSKSHIICLSRGSGFLGGPSCSCGCIRALQERAGRLSHKVTKASAYSGSQLLTLDRPQRTEPPTAGC